MIRLPEYDAEASKYVGVLTIYNILFIYIYIYIRGLLEKYPTFGREKETGLLGALDT